jgi:Uma2 family endonuclease
VTTRAPGSLGDVGADPPLATHRFTREEFDRMVELGAFEDVRVELLDGELVDVSLQGPEHAAVIRALTRWFAPRGDLLCVQLPLAATEDSEPEPDVALVQHDDAHRHPGSALLAVEVVVGERAAARRKASIYARAGVGAYWIVDVPARQVLVHEEPLSTGYRRTKALGGHDQLQPPAGLPGRPVDELFAAAGLA